jgi:hypothetical protein
MMRPMVGALALLACLFPACTRSEPSSPPGDSAGTEDGIPTGNNLIQDTVPTIVSSEPCDACGGVCLLEELEYPSTYHTTEPIAYASTPPAGGPHNPCWSTWGIHVEAVPDDNFVHNLEHGGVAFLPGNAGLAGQVDSLAVELGDFMITSPYAAQEAEMSALSWGFRLSLGCFDEGLLRTFYKDHVNHAPESILSEPSGGCM